MSLVVLGAEAADKQHVRRFGAPPPAGGATAPSLPNALTALTKYLPTETITIYLAGLALLPATYARWLDPVMTGLTPIIVLFAYLGGAAKNYAANPENVPTIDCELVLKMLFSALAFQIWIHTLPQSYPEPVTKLYGFLAILCSPFFGFLEALCPLVRSKLTLKGQE